MILFSHDLVHSPNVLDLENNLGVELFRIGEIKEAKLHFERSIELQPQWWTSHNNLGAVYEKEGNLEKAKESYEKAIENGDYYLAYQNLGQILLQTAPLEETLPFLETAVQKLPLNSRLWSMLAQVYLQSEEPEKAFVSAQRAFNLAPTETNRRLVQTLSKN